MKIGIISDTHLFEVNSNLRNIVDTYFADVDMIIHTGDLVALEVLKYFQEKNKLEAVHGNMDSPDIQELLPEKKVLSIGPFRIGIIHGWGAPRGIEERIMKQFDNVHCVVFGHTHMPINEIKDGMLFFNSGSPTDKRFAKENTVGILEIDKEIFGRIIPV